MIIKRKVNPHMHKMDLIQGLGKEIKIEIILTISFEFTPLQVRLLYHIFSSM